MSAVRERWALVAIALLGLALRLWRLGALSFSGDEETTALAARALLEGWPPVLPGGLIYVRALPFTALESLFLWLAGSGEEWALRLVSALIAVPRIAAAWWLARAFLPAAGALAVALGMAFAPLDVEYSRIARMYSLFAALDVAFLASLVPLAAGRGRAWPPALLAVAAASVHALSITHTPLAWVALPLRGIGPRARLALFGVGVVGVAAFVAEDRVLSAVYAVMGASDAAAPRASPLDLHLAELGASAAGLGALPVALGALASAGLGVWACRELRVPLARLAALASALCALAAAPVLGLCAASAALIAEGAPAQLRRHGALLLGALLAGSAGWAAAALLSGAGGGAALRLVLGFPAPNWSDFARAAPLLSLLAALGALCAVQSGCASRRPGPWLVLLAAAVAPALLSGWVTRNDALRFQLHALAPILILAVLALERGLGALAERAVPRGAALGAAALLALAALRPDLAVGGALREHGPLTDPFAQLAVAPDHRGAGRFVRERAGAQDWIAAEDSLQQRVYAGRAEFWLRRREDAAPFLRAQPGAEPREVYTGAQLLPDLQALLALSREQPQRRIWLITSAEAEVEPSFYRTPETHAQLEAWREQAVFVGADGLTRVQLLRGGALQSLADSATAPAGSGTAVP